MKSFSNRFLKIFVEYKLIMIEHDFYKFQSMKVETNNIEAFDACKTQRKFHDEEKFRVLFVALVSPFTLWSRDE